MSLNCNEINVILNELSIKDAFIQDVIQPGYDTLALYTYKEGTAKTVLICVAQNSVRINETNKKITKNDKPLRFMEFLKAHIKGCKIISCEQIGLERIIKIELHRTTTEDNLKKNSTVNSITLPGIGEAFGKKGALPSFANVTDKEIKIENYYLYIKLWNNAANVFLCDMNNIILESMFRRPEKKEMKGEKIQLPDVSDKNMDEMLLKFPVREWETGALRGCAPLEGVAEDSSTGCSEGKAGTQCFPSFNAFIDWWYSEYADNLSRESLLAKAEKWYESNKSKRENALNNLLEKKKKFDNAEQLKHYGDLILSYGHLIEKSSKFLECEDYSDGKIVRILIDPEKSIQDNASIYYKNYKKAVSGIDELEHDIEIAKTLLCKLEKQYESIINEKNPVKIEQLLRKEVTPVQLKKKTHPGLDFTINDWFILVGRDANENDDLLRHHVRGEDLWLHVRDFPGGYVFIKARKGKTVPLDILLDAANLAVYYSKARNNSKVDLYYTHVKYLRRAKNGPKGLVIPTQEKNLCISPDKKRLSRLDSIHSQNEV